MAQISNFSIVATALVSMENSQKFIASFVSDEAIECVVRGYKDGEIFVEKKQIQVQKGENTLGIFFPVQEESIEVLWKLFDQKENLLAEVKSNWKKPREWKLYAMISSHTDIGLHNSQYIQRANGIKFLDEAVELCDQTESWKEEERYRYTVEGTWFWNNYGEDKGKDLAKRLVENYVKREKINVCGGVAGNHIQTYGLEETCRSAYEKKRLDEDWGIRTETLTMIDNNGLPFSMIQPYAEAGYKNIIFAPNQWNPLPSTIWETDKAVDGWTWNPQASGGGSRIDVRYDSPLPMLFYWANDYGDKLTVWCSTQYEFGGTAFGVKSFYPRLEKEDLENVLAEMEEKTQVQLEKLEKKYPYDFWLFACYADDEKPNLGVNELFRAWNGKWAFPKFCAMGNPDKLFDEVRIRYGEKIPTLKGDITGGWYQHPLSVPELMSKKFEADRLLPIAEKWSSVASLLDAEYEYPNTEFRRAWDCLLFNDEHSYGTSGYQGRRVYETWMQHRDWIDKAYKIAGEEINRATKAIAEKISSNEEKIVVFNPTAQERKEIVEVDGVGESLVCVPSFGFTAVKKSDFSKKEDRQTVCEPPVVENAFYKISFDKSGGLRSIFDKEFRRELLDVNSEYRANQLLYTKDNHKTFISPSSARFEVIRTENKICVLVKTQEDGLGAEIEQKIILPTWEKRIEIENRLYHVKDMINDNRYYRYLYYAFPFLVENAKRYCHLNGCVAEYGKDITGHGTDVYMATRDWCCAENGKIGVALFSKDCILTEFGCIHPDKTDFGHLRGGSKIFAYVANDWLQMHVSGGSRLHYRFRFAITSYAGNYQSAKISQTAERYVTPLQTVAIALQEGEWTENSRKFIDIETDARFLCLKRADDGNGLIARFYGKGENVTFAKEIQAKRTSIDEREDVDERKERRGFSTYRLFEKEVCLKERKIKAHIDTGGKPLSIGANYTGLITAPCVGAGEGTNKLYLLWGANREENFSHYKLYRSKTSGFIPNEENFLADVLQEKEYVVGRYEDIDVEENTAYYYRVCAVNKFGERGEMSEEFFGFTREPLEQDV